MRINEYNTLDEFIYEYSSGRSSSRNNKEHKRRYMGIEFIYNKVCYRMCREPGEDETMPRLENGKIGRYDVMIMHVWMDEFKDDDEILIGWYEDIYDVLENCYIEGRKFKDVIMDDQTEIWGKD